MPKPKVKNRTLPPRMTLRTYRNSKGDLWTGYYYEHKRDAAGKRKATPLGSDLAEAKMMWAEIEGRPLPKDDDTLASLYSKYMAWAEDRTASGISVRTIADRKTYWRFLEPVFGSMAVNDLLPEHMLPYFHARSTQVSAKKEIKFLSVMCNWARARGLMNAPNPVTGLTRQMKVDERRHVYVSDVDLALVYKHASDTIRNCLDIAYLTGQRPDDVRKLRWSQIKNNCIEISQGKTEAKLRIEIVGELKEVIDRIKSQSVMGVTILTDPKGQPLKQSGHFRNQFDKARDLAEDDAKKRGIEFQRFQFRDLRPKAATDLESLAGAQKLLGHTSERMTAAYIRARKGDIVQPLMTTKGGNG